ncbi:hypothetical protein ABFX02_05G092100 [Erythranthe guttata]
MMFNMGFTSFLFIICILNFNQFLKAENLGVYIVHVEPTQSDDLETFYDSFLPTTSNVTSNSEDQPRILYRYRHVFSGFAAKLSAAHVDEMRKKKGFISARPERMMHLHTTHSPNFLGLNQNTGLWKNSSYGKGIIIGLVDTGITPDHPSLNDQGVPPPPAKWKGKCEFTSPRWTCNNKLIGARYFYRSPPLFVTPLIDQIGHGTHTSGIAAGNFVGGADFYGNARGTASGTAPLAHVAIYQPCKGSHCGSSGIAAAIDAAIEDGVDVLSMSLGGALHLHFADDIMAIGTFRAMERGIVVSCSAGNDGPKNKTLYNEAPWIMTVGASTTDRKITVNAVLGNGEELEGETGTGFPAIGKLDLVYPRSNDTGMSRCFDGHFNTDIKGKIVVCEGMKYLVTRVQQGITVKGAGGAAMILINNKFDGDTTFEEPHVLPAMQITYADSLKLKAYLNSTSNPTATMSFKGTVIGNNRAPVVATFSSRGPSVPSPGILKPDIIGPGVNILSSWPASVDNSKTDTKSPTFNMISGTSMSCPHLSGVAALLKSVHPDWSPAAIKSAIMTTADSVNLEGKPIEDEQLQPASVFAIGSGHVNPSRANNPGLVYDIMPDDYIPYLCGLNYTNQEIGIIVGRKVDCSEEKSIPEAQLNYPSFSIIFGSTPQTYTRTLTNVGKANSSYVVEIASPDGVIVKVEPQKLVFPKLGDKSSYSVTFTRTNKGVMNNTTQGFIRWHTAEYSVRSPIAVVFQN